MSDTAIAVEGLSKMYRIGVGESKASGLGGRARQLAGSPFAYLQRMRRPPTEEETLWALKEVSFEVKRGEVVGIIGRNGAGKSTLLKILSRITEPTGGRAVLHGRVGSLLEVGTGFHPELTGRENVYLSGAILGMRREEIESKFDEIVDFSGIEKFIDTPIKRYSSGMNVRLGFSVAAHLEPEILLVDEVLAVGDFQFQQKALGKMGDVVGQGRTVLFVSHNLNAVSQLCPRAYLFDGGTLASQGPSDQVVSEYLDNKGSWVQGQKLEEWDLAARPSVFIWKARVGSDWLPSNAILRTNQPLDLEIYVNRNGKKVKGFRAGFHISTREGLRILSFATPWSNLGEGIQLDGPARFVCSVPNLPLIPGKYFLSIGCMEGNKQLDWLENVATFTVIPGDTWMDRLVPTYKLHGYFDVKTKWRAETLSSVSLGSPKV